MNQRSLAKTQGGFLPDINGPRSTQASFLPEINPQRFTQRKQQVAKKLPTFKTIRKISKAKFSVYLVHCEAFNQQYAMKVFPYKDGRLNSCFLAEARFTNLNHPNVIKTIGSEQCQETVSNDKPVKVSYLITEFAPNGDFHDIVVVKKALTDEKIARTYFRQLIDGLEYLHARRIAHLDLKLENLLLGKDFNLKIADFDLAYMKGDPKITTKGTIYYRAPELMDQRCNDVEAADVYAAGIILFVFKSGGILPHSELQLYRGMNLLKMITEDNNSFWQKHCEIQGKPSHFFDAEFRKLFNACTSLNPSDRPTLGEIKRSRWYNGPIYSQQEITKIMSRNLKTQG